MKRENSIGTLEKDVFEGDLSFSRLEYLPVAVASMRGQEVTDSIEAYAKIADIIEKGEPMRDVEIGDENASMSFVREEGQNTVMVTIKKDGKMLQLPYDAEELAVAIRFITAENSTGTNE